MNERMLHRFPGGLHPEQHKSESNGTPIQPAHIVGALVLPLKQHIGAAARPVVSVGERVLRNKLLAKADGFVSAPIHAPTSGTIVAIEDRPVAHPSGLSASCIVLEPDGRDEAMQAFEPWPHYFAIAPILLRERVRDAGIVGLGGAAFPSAVKMAGTPGTPIHTVVLNGAECEPYITCDDRLMRERAGEVLQGGQIIMHMVGASKCLVGVEDNKPEAIAALRKAAASLGDPRIDIVPIPTIYPSGAEKQLIYVLTGERISRETRATERGFLGHNVATAAAVYRAVVLGEPLTRRIVTLTGSGMQHKGNWEVPLGMLACDLIAQAGGYAPDVARLILGGPMMGFAMRSDEVPVTKATNCLLALAASDVPDHDHALALPCIRCGRCAEACPVELQPQQLLWDAKAGDFERAEKRNSLFECIECGICAVVCPSHIPLVQYFRYAKTEIWQREREKDKAAKAKERFEARNARIEREKREREEMLAKKRAQLAAQKDEGESASAAADEKRKAIQDALERVKARKAAQQQSSADGARPTHTANEAPDP
ncbi:MAG: electron transport complex subunit RsxC [Halothiobacillaceae bacterium]